jgi:uncharacterized protein YfaS (alpha-2-macroglobulin family)
MHRILLISLLSFIGILSSCKKPASPTPGNTPVSSETYSSDWQEIEKMERNGMGKSIIAKTDDILQKALEDNNINQVFKALAYRSRYSNHIEENATQDILEAYEEKIQSTTFPLKQLLHSATAELYLQYYQQNRWRFQNRSNTVGFDPQDLRSWSLDKILNTIQAHYQQSLNNKEDLLQFPTEHLLPILHPGDNDTASIMRGLALRPSLYDFLAGRALTFYMRNEGSVVLPVEEFSIDNYELFASAEAFTQLSFTTQDTASNQYRSCRLFQDLLETHMNDANPAVFVDFELERLRHFYTSSKKEAKDSLYLKRLLALSESYNQLEIKDKIDFRIASLYSIWGHEYDASSGDDRKRWYLKKAATLCKSKADRQNIGALQCKALLKELQEQRFNFQSENTYLPNSPLLIKLQYQNTPKLYFRLLKVAYQITPGDEFIQTDERIKQFLKKTAIREWTVTLAEIEDLQMHSTDLQVEKLGKGNYYLLVSDDKDFRLNAGTVAINRINISQLAYFSRQSPENNTIDVHVRDRNDGAAASAVIHAYTPIYDYSSRKNNYKSIGKFQTDPTGFVRINSAVNGQQFQFTLTSETDTLNSQSSYYLYSRHRNETKSIRTHYFSDRAIYRPGQTVFFKGILVESDSDQKTPKANYSTEVVLFNVNGEKLQSLKLTSNDYGSISGSFVLPNSGLNGNYRIQDQHGSLFFRVEEYKRPSFEITVDSSNEVRSINEALTIKGQVNRYSGTPLSDAQVRYRVVRKANYPYWSPLRSFFPPSNEKEIANGTMLSDSKGNFSFRFVPQADPGIQTSWNPIYSFEILLEATSPDGETQDLSHLIQLSQQGVYLSADIAQAIQLEELKKLRVNAKNIDGKQVQATANLSLWSLKTPLRPKKPLLWSSSDIETLSPKEFEQLFPSYPKPIEQGIETYERDYELLQQQVSCNQNINVFNQLKPGAYELVLSTKDKNGKEVTWKKRFVLFDENAREAAYPMFSWFHPLKVKAEPGENASFLFASSLKQLRLLYEIELDGKIISSEWLLINQQQRKFSIPIKESYRGNITIHLTGIHSDRLIQYHQSITVPYSNKQLQLQLGTFRSKVHPGDKEKWTLTVKGHEGKVLNTEVLASMYDQSLDQYNKQDWAFQLFSPTHSRLKWDVNESFHARHSQGISKKRVKGIEIPRLSYPILNWFGFHLGYGSYYARYGYRKEGLMLAEAKSLDNAAPQEMNDGIIVEQEAQTEADKIEERSSSPSTETETPPLTSIRKNFNETAFFYPQLTNDENGEVHFEFTLPDALTQWKFRAIAHSKELESATLEQLIQSHKELMIFPNVPRFVREGDEFILKTTITNKSDSAVKGFASLKLSNAMNGRPLELFVEASADPTFEIEANESTVVSWRLKIPSEKRIEALQYTISAETEHFKDGEENVIPVLSKRMLVTESLPLWVRGNQQKTFSFEHLINAANSSTLENKSFTLEFTPNPAWYAIQALPVLDEQQEECSEKVFARLYANSIAEKIVNSQPRIKAVFESWKRSQSIELQSKLLQNQELKSILIEETPWLQEAKSETEQKRRIALLFDLNHMAQEKKAMIRKLQELQLPNGGWSWYKGMRDNRYITQYIVEGLGHLQKLGVKLESEPAIKQMLKQALAYLDTRIEEDYQHLLEQNLDLQQDHLGHLQLHYLYTRSFFRESAPSTKAFQYYLKQAKQYWLNRSIYDQGMIALATHRLYQDEEPANSIIRSLNDNALQSEELGMYWKSNQGGYYWHQAPIETQALLIELYEELNQPGNSIEEMKIWLLKQKQVQSWSNSKATAAACYALLLRGSNLLSTASNIDINVGSEHINTAEQEAEAGSWYFKKVWPKEDIKADMGKISVRKNNEGIAWGAAYWQYYEDIDQVKEHNSGAIRITKELFKSYTTNKGIEIRPINAGDIQVGDKIIVRLRLETDRTMEFVHLKDMRAASFEPINVLSQYKYQDGLGYYESTKDASTNFFMDWLPKGVYVFEYALRASLEGDFSSGTANIQCQYAPEFTAHSKGQRVKIVSQ